MTKKNTGMLALAAFLIIALITLVVLNLNSPGEDNSGTYSFKGHNLSLQVNEVPEGWGYTIFIDKDAFIVQNHIPGVPGKVSFENADDAKLCGKLMMEKIVNGKTPTVF